MFVNKDQASRLITAQGDFTLAQAFGEANVPAGLLQVIPNPEDWFVIGHRLAWGGARVNAAAGGISYGGIGINATDPTLVIVERIIASVGTTGDLHVRFSEAAAIWSTSGALVSRDAQRTLTAAETVGIVNDNTPAGLIGSQAMVLNVTASTPVYLDSTPQSPVAILGNGVKGDTIRQLAVSPSAVNIFLAFGIWCRVLSLRSR